MTIITRTQLSDLLHSGECVVEFTKVNGEVRSMPCTLKAELVPPATVKVLAEGEVPKVKKENIDVITNAMLDVNRFGTSAAAFKGASYNAAGKTGTAQVFSLNSKTYSHSSTPEFLRDHALYIVFAPAEKPKIAIAMVVENAGFGAAQAAPIARKALDYYIEGRWPKEIPEWKNAP